MIVSRLRALFPITTFVLLTSALTMGCGGTTSEDLCNKCESARSQLDLCVGEIDREQARAEEAGCASQWQGFIDCVVDKATCSSAGDLEPEVCNPEEDVYHACIKKK